MYLKFTTKEEAQNCLNEINTRMDFDGITQSYTVIEDVVDGYAILKPSDTILEEKKIMLRDTDIQGISGIETITKVVKKQYDDNENDITEYDGREYTVVKQKKMSDLFNYIVID